MLPQPLLGADPKVAKLSAKGVQRRKIFTTAITENTENSYSKKILDTEFRFLPE
jgi:hypothetical protein